MMENVEWADYMYDFSDWEEIECDGKCRWECSLTSDTDPLGYSLSIAEEHDEDGDFILMSIYDNKRQELAFQDCCEAGELERAREWCVNHAVLALRWE